MRLPFDHQSICNIIGVNRSSKHSNKYCFRMGYRQRNGFLGGENAQYLIANTSDVDKGIQISLMRRAPLFDNKN